MKSALIGYTGFVGSTLLKQAQFVDLFNSKNISLIENKSYDFIVCAGAPAQKWIANSKPLEDTKNVDSIINHLSTVTAKKFILISTVDVFQSPLHVNEDTPVDERDLHPYGFNRRRLEKFVESHFADSLIIRLPGLVGPGLKKNVIFDLLNENLLEKLESRGIFQFYPMVNLWPDIQKYVSSNLRLVHLTSAPVSVSEIAEHCFNLSFKNEVSVNPARYDFKSLNAGLFGGTQYQYTKREIILAIRCYAQSEPRSKV